MTFEIIGRLSGGGYTTTMTRITSA